jgi:hypothetical protein
MVLKSLGDGLGWIIFVERKCVGNSSIDRVKRLKIHVIARQMRDIEIYLLNEP